jgi:hypothetical protein
MFIYLVNALYEQKPKGFCFGGVKMASARVWRVDNLRLFTYAHIANKEYKKN